MSHEKLNLFSKWGCGNIRLSVFVKYKEQSINYVKTFLSKSIISRLVLFCQIHSYLCAQSIQSKPSRSLFLNPLQKVEPLQGRFLPLNTMSSVGFYGPSTATVSPVFHYPYHFSASQYINPEMYRYSFYRDKGIAVLPGYMSQCYHPALPGMSHYNTDNEKPTQSYIGLIGKAILSSPQQKLVLGDIYNYILTNYPYFRNKGPGWRNSIRHNLSLNDCFVKVGRSPNGKGHFWAINPVNYDDFSRGDYKRKRTSRRNREISHSTKEKWSSENSSVKSDELKTPGTDVWKSESNIMPCSKTNTLEKRGFHIETLLSNKWEEIKTSEVQSTVSAFILTSALQRSKEESF